LISWWILSTYYKSSEHTLIEHTFRALTRIHYSKGLLAPAIMTYAILIAFQRRKKRHYEIRNASDIFEEARENCIGASSYASALLLSYLLVKDAMRWDKLLIWGPMAAQLLSERTTSERSEQDALMLAAMAQLAGCFIYAVGVITRTILTLMPIS
jgi:hypothetical protein